MTASDRLCARLRTELNRQPARQTKGRESLRNRPQFWRSAIVAARKLSPLQASEARRIAAEEAKKNKKPVVRSDAEKAAYQERIGKARDAISRSVGIKGDHVVAARAALKDYLRRLNEPKQPDDARFEALIEAPFKVPPKKKSNDRY